MTSFKYLSLAIIIATLSGCNSGKIARDKQQNEIAIANLQYKFSNSDNLREQIALVKEIMNLDYQNKFAIQFNNAQLYQPKDKVLQREVARNIALEAYNHLDDRDFVNYALYAINRAKIAPTESDLLMRAYLKYQLENDKINLEFLNKNSQNFYYAKLREQSFGNFDLIDQLFQALIPYSAEMKGQMLQDFELAGFDFYHYAMKQTPKAGFFQKDYRKFYKSQREYFLNQVVKNRRNYLLNNPAELVDVLSRNEEVEIAFDMADDYKNIAGIENFNKQTLRAFAFEKAQNYRKAFDTLYQFKDNKQIQSKLVALAIQYDNLEDALKIFADNPVAANDYFALNLYINLLLLDEQFDKAKAEIDKLKNNRLIYLVNLNNYEMKINRPDNTTLQLLLELLNDKSEQAKANKNTIIMSILDRAAKTKDRELLLYVYNEAKKNENFEQDAMMLNNIGYTMMALDFNLEEANQLISDAYLIAPNNSIIIDSMAWNAYKNGRYADAKKYIDIILNAPDEYVALETGIFYLHAGDIYRANNLEAEAMQFYERAANEKESDNFKYSDLKTRFKK